MAHLLPYLDTENTYLNPTQVIFMVVTVYCSSVMFASLLAFALYNTYMYIYKQSKWRTIPLLFFYLLANFTLAFRIYDTIFIMKLAEEFTIPSIMVPPTLKMCIGLI